MSQNLENQFHALNVNNETPAASAPPPSYDELYPNINESPIPIPLMSPTHTCGVLRELDRPIGFLVDGIENSYQSENYGLISHMVVPSYSSLQLNSFINEESSTTNRQEPLGAARPVTPIISCITTVTVSFCY